MAEHGYRAETGGLTETQHAVILRTARQAWLTGNRTENLEVHWAVTPRTFPVPLDPEELMARARETTIAGLKTWSLAVEDLLLILCVNGAKNQ